MNYLWIWCLVIITNGSSDYKRNSKHDIFEREDEDPIPNAPRYWAPGATKVQDMKNEALLSDQGRNQLCGIMVLRRLMKKKDTGRTNLWCGDIWCCYMRSSPSTPELPRDLFDRTVEMLARDIPWTAYPLPDLLRVLDARLGRMENPIWVAVCHLHSMLCSFHLMSNQLMFL